MRLGITLEYGGCNFATWRLIRKLKKEKPDSVHLHCLNGSCVNIYSLLHFLGKNKIKTVVTHHAEFYYTGSCPHAYDCYGFVDCKCVNCPTPRTATQNRIGNRAHEAWLKMRNAFATFNKTDLTFTVVSPWVKERSQHSFIVKDFPCRVILNGVDTSVFTRQIDRDFFQKSNLVNRINNLLFVTANFNPKVKTHNKGGWYIVELAKRMPNSTFIVVTSVMQNVDSLPSNIYVFGKASSSQELAKLYSFANVTLIASRRETFSMVLAESLCCGTPVVGFKAGGPESIAMKEYCELVEYGNIEKYEEAVKRMLNQNFNRERISAEAKLLYGSTIMKREYVDLYKSMQNNI